MDETLYPTKAKLSSPNSEVSPQSTKFSLRVYRSNYFVYSSWKYSGNLISTPSITSLEKVFNAQFEIYILWNLCILTTRKSNYKSRYIFFPHYLFLEFVFQNLVCFRKQISRLLAYPTVALEPKQKRFIRWSVDKEKPRIMVRWLSPYRGFSMIARSHQCRWK